MATPFQMASSDENAIISYCSNKSQVENEYAFDYTFKAFLACIKLFEGKPLSKVEQHYVSEIKYGKTDHFDGDLFVKDLGEWLFHEGAFFKTEENYNKARDSFYEKLRTYLLNNADTVINLLKEEIARYRLSNM